MYKHTNYFDKYGRIMQFNKNKMEPFHRWYPFVEGYSREFIRSIVREMNRDDLVCLEPFSGSGTTALELQNLGIPCYAFEVNPLMYLIARVKMEDHYQLEDIDYWNDYIKTQRVKKQVRLKTRFSTLYQGNGKKKWNYNTEAGVAVEKLRQSIEAISDDIYRDLFKVALASILLDVSNLYRNGKCLSYKRKWEERTILEPDVFEEFDNKVINELRNDIETMSDRVYGTNNKERLYNLDSRVGINDKIDNESVDLVITSPPYLNSRDYTDTYMLELKTLGFAKSDEEIKALREKTLRSHVQIRWNDKSNVDNVLLKRTLAELEEASKGTEKWNESIIDMVRLYFVDMQSIFRVLYSKMKNAGRVYFNVSNSAYFNVLVETIEICASIAEQEGFSVLEIRDARQLKTSPQQQERVGKLLEGVIVLEKRD